MKDKIKRYDYKPKKYGLSEQNEPGVDMCMGINIRNYPDMYYAYEIMAERLGIDSNRLMLGNGCENVLKNVLLALKPKSISWATPNWNMMEVYCSALDIEPDKHEFVYMESGKEFIEPSITNYECYYDNDGVTPWFHYRKNSSCHSANGWRIIDLTYKRLDDVKSRIKELKDMERTIIVCSLGKIYGAGARLGFAIFPEELRDAMMLQREQYINMAAYQLIVSQDLKKQPSNPFHYSLKDYIIKHGLLYGQGIWLTDNFISFDRYIPNELNSKDFYVGSKRFMKLGIPYTRTELDSVVDVIIRGNYE